MILSGDAIKTALSLGDLEISPPPAEDQYTTSAVDLFLGDQFSGWDDNRLLVPGFQGHLDLSKQDFGQTARAYLVNLPRESDGSFIFLPYRERQVHVLGITRESVHLKRSARLAARVEGRSSLARIGLVVHLTAPTIHAGFNGRIALEMVNFGPFHLRLVPEKTRICQLIVEMLESAPTSEVRTKFQGQTKPSGEQE